MQKRWRLQASTSILIVEDDPTVGFALDDYLRHCGHDVTLADSAEVARRAMAGRRYDLLLADLRLAGTDTVDGLDLAAEALRRRRIDHAIIVTAWSDDATVARASVIGVDAVVKKPLPLAELAALVGTITRRDRTGEP